MFLPRHKKNFSDQPHPSDSNQLSVLESEQKYQQIFELSPEAIAIFDRHGRLVEANERLFDWLGYHKKEVIGLSMLELPYLSPKSKAIITKNFALRMTGKKVEPYVLTFIAKDGHEEEGLIDARTIKDSSGKSLYDLVMVANLSTRKKFQTVISKSEEKFKNLFTSSLEGIVFTDLKGKIFDANQAYLDLTGYSMDELTRMTTFQLTPTKWHQFEKEVISDQILQRGFSDEYEKEYIRKDGSVIPVSLRKWVGKNESGEPIGFWSVFRDISTRKRAEESIVRREMILEAVNLVSTQLMTGSWKKNAQHIFSEFGRALKASRFYIFANDYTDPKEPVNHLLFEWDEVGIEKYLAKGGSAQTNFKAGLFPPATQELSRGRIFGGLASQVSPAVQKIIHLKQIKSFALAPVFVHDEWWGVMGVDDCVQDRKWNEAELDALQTVANILGASIQREQDEMELKRAASEQAEKNQELQKFNQLMVGRELKMIELKEKNTQLIEQLTHLQQALDKSKLVKDDKKS